MLDTRGNQRRGMLADQLCKSDKMDYKQCPKEEATSYSIEDNTAKDLLNIFSAYHNGQVITVTP